MYVQKIKYIKLASSCMDPDPDLKSWKSMDPDFNENEYDCPRGINWHSSLVLGSLEYLILFQKLQASK